MPTYDYICDSCGHEMEVFQSMTAALKRKCPECGKPTLKRQIGSGGGIIFKGSGFFQTDYRSESYKKSAAAEKNGAEGKPDKKKKDAKAAGSEGKSKDSDAAKEKKT